jgi:hypothetical protein
MVRSAPRSSLLRLCLLAFLMIGASFGIGCMGDRGPRSTASSEADLPNHFDSPDNKTGGLLEVDDTESTPKLVMPAKAQSVLQQKSPPPVQGFTPNQ